MTVPEWEEKMLALPIARSVSGEHEEHRPGDDGFIMFPAMPTPATPTRCRCDRCKIIRIKKRRAFRFPRLRCPRCRKLFTSLFVGPDGLCRDCREEKEMDDET